MKFPLRSVLTLLLAVSAPAFLTGCNTRKHASFGHPGAFVYRQSLETVGLALMEEFKSKGYELGRSRSRELVFDKKEGAGGSLMHGDWAGGPVYTRVTVEIIDMGDGQKLFATVRKVRNRGDWATEESSWSMAGGGSEVQEILDKVQGRFPAGPNED